MRLRIASSGRRPRAASRFSRTCTTFVVAGIAAGHGGVRDDELEDDLRPRHRVDLGGPGGQRVAFQRAHQRTLAKRPVGDHRDAAVARERQQPLLGLAVEDVVRQLHEVERMRAHQLLDLAVAPALGRGDADVADPARRLHLEQDRQVLLPGEQVVHLHEIEARHVPVAARFLHLRAAARARADPHLLRREQLRRPAELAQAVADHGLRRAVHRRGIDHPPACREECAHYLGTGVAGDGIVADVEGDPRAQPDDGHGLARGGNRPREDGRGLLARAEAGQREGGGPGARGEQYPAAREFQRGMVDRHAVSVPPGGRFGTSRGWTLAPSKAEGRPPWPSTMARV